MDIALLDMSYRLQPTWDGSPPRCSPFGLLDSDSFGDGDSQDTRLTFSRKGRWRRRAVPMSRIEQATLGENPQEQLPVRVVQIVAAVATVVLGLETFDPFRG